MAELTNHCDVLMSDSLNFSEEFNDRILCPELLDSEKMMLHKEVKKIYETYCLDESVDKIRFDPFIVEEIRNSMWQESLLKLKCLKHPRCALMSMHAV